MNLRLLAVFMFWMASIVILAVFPPTLSATEYPEETVERRERVGDISGVPESEEEEEIELSEDDQFTLDRMREFWKKEDFLHEEKIEFLPFKVPPRKDELEFYPCMDCHEDDELAKGQERKLTEEHDDVTLNHGANRFWCLTCHFQKNLDYLRSLKNRRISFNRSYLLCGQCHFQRQGDWFTGGHGKRIGNWGGERVILVCTECHNSHSPTIKPKRPDPPPVRHEKIPNWMVIFSRNKKTKSPREPKVWEILEEKLGLKNKE